MRRFLRSAPGAGAWRGAIALVVACVALVACESRTDVSATASVPPGYSHVWLTVEQVWLNASETAGPDDAGWLRFRLDPPQTLDLAALTDGTSAAIARGLKVPPGTYAQLRLVLADSSASLADPARSAGALFNNEADFFDAEGTEHRVPLRIANAEQGIAIPLSLKVPDATEQVLTALSARGSITSGSGAAFTSGAGTTDLTTGSTTTGSTTTGSTTGSTTTGSTTGAAQTPGGSGTSAAPGSAGIVFDAARDLVPFSLSGELAVLLNPGFAGVDLGSVGTIQGQLDLAALPSGATGAAPDVRVSAETPGEDGTRHVVVRSASVASDGTFVLFPLSTAEDQPASYDLVIHGPQVQTVIIRSVPVSRGRPDSAATVALGGLALAPANAFAANFAEGASVSPRGARVGFYQTLPGTGEVPYLIEEMPADPFTGRLAPDALLSSADLVFGTFASGQSLSLESAEPVEGPGAYAVALSAPVFGAGSIGPIVAAADATADAPATFTVDALSAPDAPAAVSVQAAVNVASPGRYDSGALIITHDGAIVTVAPLGASLAQARSTLVLPEELPAGSASERFDAGLYFAEGWVWSSRDPAGTFSRHPASAPLDLRATSAGRITIEID